MKHILENKKNINKKNWKTIPWHVLLFAIYPILALYANNITEVSPTKIWIPLACSLGGAILCFLILHLWLHNWQRAALLTTIFILQFFSYGHVYFLLKGIKITNYYIFRHRTLLPVWIGLLALGIWWGIRKRTNLQGTTAILNILAIGLLILPTIQIVSGLWKQRAAWINAPQSTLLSSTGEVVPNNPNSPDIYYIILDSYPRSDTLKQSFNYDNSDFLNFLDEKGFYVADCSQSNYNQTELSLASSLNMDYLDILDDRIKPGDTNRAYLYPLIRNSTVRHFLEARGYKTVAFATGFLSTEIIDVNLYLAPQPGQGMLDEFEYMLVRTTMGRLVLDAEFLSTPNSWDEMSRLRTEFVLRKLNDMPSVAGPKFVFAHLVIPHPPFVFGPNGEEAKSTEPLDEISFEEYSKGFVNQTKYINKQTEEIISRLLTYSTIPPIIILQGDHGPGMGGDIVNMSILNAYYLPDIEAPLYSQISPVNTFRIVLNGYFEKNLPLLSDYSYFSSSYETPYDFTEIPNECVKQE